MKTDVIKTLIEIGINEDHLIVSDKSKNCYHPGRSGSVNLKTVMENYWLNLVKFTHQLFLN